MEELKAILGLGLEAKDLNTIQVCIRGIIIFFYCLLLVRIADKRFLSRKTALDAVLGFILASMIARGINGSAPFVPTLAGGLVMVLLHRALAHASMRWHRLGGLVKGSADVVIRNGQLVESNLRQNNFSEADMLEDLRLNGITSPEQVELAHIERNGSMSVVKKET